MSHTDVQDRSIDAGGPAASSDGSPSRGASRRRGLRLLKGNALTAVLFLILGFLIVIPMGVLLYATFVDTPPRPGAGVGSFTWANYQALLSAGGRTATMNSLLVGFFGTTLAMLFGCGLAWVVARTDAWGKRLISVIAVVPLFVSPLIGAIAWGVLASPRAGYINMLFRDLGLGWTFDVYTIPGMILVFSLYYSPYVFLFVSSALHLMNPELEEAAEVHGGRLRHVISNVTFRIIAPAVLGAGVLVMMLIMENFSVPTVLGSPGGTETLSSRIYRLMAGAPSNPNEAAATGMALFVITFTLVYVQRRIITTRQYTTVTGKGLKPRVVELKRGQWPVLAFVSVYALLAVVLPFFALFEAALRQVQFVPNTLSLFDFSVFGLDNFRDVIALDAFRTGLVNSLILGVSTGAIGGVLYFTLSYVVYRTRKPGRRYLEYVAMWPLAVPSLIIGMGYLWTWINLPLAIYGTLVILMLAFLGRFMPQGFRATSSTIGQVHKELEESAMMSGASKAGAITRITVPLARRGILSAMLLLFILSMRELSTAIFLYTSQSQVLSIVVFNQWESGYWPRVAAISLLYSGLLLVIVFVGQRWFGVQATGAATGGAAST